MDEQANDPLTLSRRYFDAWRRQDAAAIAATLAPDGHYQDPTTGGPLPRQALAAYAEGLWAAFPDLDFALGDVHRVGDATVHAEWIMSGHNSGSFNGLPPTGRAVELPGIDVIRCGPQGIAQVQGYFDSAALPRQLGLQVVVQPVAIGPFAFGTATTVRRPEPVMPAVFAVTELIAASDESLQAVREQARQVVLENIDNPDFLGFNSSVCGRRMNTFSAWRSHQAMAEAMHRGTHVESMRAFGQLAEGGYTAVYAPVRVGPWLRRCSACGAMARFEGHRGTCADCGAAVEALP